MIPRLVSLLRWKGDSVEVGVFKGRYSQEILHYWPAGRKHLLVDAWASFNASCKANTKNQKLSGDKQCRFSQAKFDATYEVARSAMARYGDRAVVQRNFSVQAAATVPPQSLDFMYIDARHDYEGLSEDLRAWWSRLCPGGLIAGHDYDNVAGMPVARAVGEFVRSLGPTSDGSSPIVFITADHPPSWFFFRPPRAC